MIVFPVTEKASEEEEYTVVVDATGRALDTSEVIPALNDADKVERERDYWRSAAIYLADCHAATAYEYERPSASQSSKRRMISILQTCVSAMENKFAKANHGRSEPDVMDRCENTIERLKKYLKKPITRTPDFGDRMRVKGFQENPGKRRR